MNRKTRYNLLTLFIFFGGLFILTNPILFPETYADDSARILMFVAGLVIFMCSLGRFVDLIKEVVHK